MKEPHHKTANANFEPLRATRRTALRGAGLAGILALASGSATASQHTSEANAQQTDQQSSAVDESIPVPWGNYPRANCHASFQATVDEGGFGQLYNFRNITPVSEQLDVEANRDTIYSLGVFDLTEPVTITLPDSGDRYQSMNVQNKDQYVKLSVTEPGTYTITRDLVGTRVVG